MDTSISVHIAPGWRQFLLEICSPSVLPTFPILQKDPRPPTSAILSAQPGIADRFPRHPSGEPGVSRDFWGSQEGCQGPSRPSGRNRGLPLRRRGGQGPQLAKRWEPRGFSRVAAGFSSYDGDLSLLLGLALGSPIFPSGCQGKLGVALESLQGLRDLT